MAKARVEWYEDKIVNRVNTALQVAMKRAVLMIEADAKRLVAVDTGRLRASITNQVRQITRDVIEGRIGSNLSYSAYQELGTSKMPAQPYLRPALEKNFPKIVRMIRRAA